MSRTEITRINFRRIVKATNPFEINLRARCASQRSLAPAAHNATRDAHARRYIHPPCGAHRRALFGRIHAGGDGRRTARECPGAVGVVPAIRSALLRAPSGCWARRGVACVKLSRRVKTLILDPAVTELNEETSCTVLPGLHPFCPAAVSAPLPTGRRDLLAAPHAATD
jgi:hypothetical protein